jgi:hypothetical protein
MPIPKPNSNEKPEAFINRCMADAVMIQEYPNEQQRLAVCASNIKLAKQRISFDYDGTISTKKGTELAKQLIENNVVYIISARSSKDGMYAKAKELGIPFGNVYATGSNEAKIQKIKDLHIDKHYDNNADVIDKLKGIGIKF